MEDGNMQKNRGAANCKKWFAVIAAVVVFACVSVGIWAAGRAYGEEKLQEQKQQELQEFSGAYNTESIVLADTNPEQAQRLADLLQARLRITADGSYAVLYLPEGLSVEDVYSSEEYKSYLSAMSLDYYVDTEVVDANNRPLSSARPSFVVTDELYPQQNYLDYINLYNTWEVTRGAGITVAVIDSGIDTDHPDFRGRISDRSYDATNDRVVSDFGLEVIEDEDGHGTSVAGIIAAGMNDGVGITGIAPEVELIVIKCETDGKGHFLRSSDLVFGLAYAIECDVDVVNMSFGTNQNVFSKYTKLAVDSDIICVAAAGNDGSAMPNYPAADENVIGVGALDMGSWTLADYSNYGFSLVLAPGTAYTTALNGGYQSATGTSISSPVVASAVALYLSQNPYTQFAEMCELLKASSVDLGVLGEDRQHAFGALDIHALVCQEKGTITYEMLTDELKSQTQIFVKGHTVQYMPEPERANVVLDGWYHDIECTDEVEYLETVFNSDVTLYAAWINEDDGTAYIYRNLEDGTVEIQSYTGRRRYLTIPATLEGKTVSSIGEYAFSGNTRLRSVIMPETLTNISSGAFSDCIRLRAIEIPEKVQSIGEYAFFGCVSMSKVSLMKNSALTEIGNRAFSMCGISTFHLPAKLMKLGSGVFYGSTAMSSVTVAEENRNYQVLNGAVYDAAGTTLLYYPAALSGNYVLKNDTVAVADYAFAYSCCFNVSFNEGIQTLGLGAFANSKIRKAELTASLTRMDMSCFNGSLVSTVTFAEGTQLSEIPELAFAYCSNLRSITVPASVAEIGNCAFAGTPVSSVTFESGSRLSCIGMTAFAGCPLTSVDFPASVSEIGGGAFSGCQNLKNVTWSSDSALRSIGEDAFSYCTALKSIALPDKLASVGYRAFYGSGLENLTIGASLIDLGDGAFSGCRKLINIDVSEDNPNYMGIDGVVFSKDNTALYMFPAGRSGTYTVPAYTTRIANYAFAEAEKLTDVVLNAGLTEIGGYAFSQCAALQTPILPASLTTIGENAFEYCSAMSGTISIPKSVIEIGRFAFFDDYALTRIVIEPESELSRIGYGTFGYCGITDFTVPGSVSSMGQEVFVGCKNLLTVTFEADSRLEAIAAWTFTGADMLRQITFEEGSALKLLEARSLEGLRKLERVTLENCTQLTNIDNYAFQNCASLSEVTLPESLSEIGRYAFNGCRSLGCIDLPEGITLIGRYAFNNTNNINVYFRASVLPLHLEENWNYGINGYHVSTAEVVTSGDWQYALTSDGKASIVAYTGSDANINLSTIDGHEIISIGGYAFADNAALQTIILPDTLQGVYQYAFKGTTALQTITIPASVAIIDNGAFQGSAISGITFEERSALVNLGRYVFADTANLTSISIPDGVNAIRDYAFRNSTLQEIVFGANSALTEIGRFAFESSALRSITLPAGVEKIDYDAFYSCAALTNADMSKTAKLQIFANAFYGSGLTEVTIPAGVEYIGEFCFTACRNLMKINVDAANENYASDDGILYNKAMTKLITCPAGITGSYTVPSTVTTLGFAAFEGSQLSEVVFSADSQLVTLGYRVFYNCDNLLSITVPAGVQSIDNYAFAECGNLESVTFAEGSQLSGIYSGAFYNDTALKAVCIPDGVQEISDYAFYGCSALTELDISESSQLKGIYDFAFAYSGVTEFAMPAGLLEVGTSAFQGAKLDTLVCNDAVVEIGDYAFADCGLANTTVLEFPETVEYMGYGNLRNATGIEDLTIPFLGTSRYLADPMREAKLESLFGKGFQMQGGIDSLRRVAVLNGTVVGIYGFGNCQNLQQVCLPDTITEIGQYAFNEANIKEITLPKNLVTLHPYAFARSNVEKVVFPNSLVTIGEHCFEYCSLLTDAVLPESIQYIGKCAFMWTGLSEVSLPASVIECGDAAFSGCQNLEMITVSEENTAYKAVDGMLYTADLSRLISVPGKLSGEVVILEGVVTIGEYAFTGCEMEGVKLPDSLKIIERWAFDCCMGLKNVVIPDSVENIGIQAFVNCGELRTVVLSESMKDIPVGMFEGCPNLESVTMSEGVVSIGERAFQGTALKQIDLPATLVSVGDGAFSACNALKSINVDAQNPSYASKDGILYDKNYEKLLIVPKSLAGSITIADGVKMIGKGAFSDCMQLEEVILPESLERIEEFGFYSCTNLRNVEIGDQVTYIGQNAFIGSGLFYDHNNWENGILYIGKYLINAFDSQDSYGTSPMPSKSIAVKDGTKLLAEACFAHTNVEHMFLPDSVQYINRFAFSQCKALRSVRMSETIKLIDDYAFADCNSLYSVSLPGADTVVNWAFGGCENLTYAFISNPQSSYHDSVGLKCLKVNQASMDLCGYFSSNEIKVLINNSELAQAEIAAQYFAEVYTYAENIGETTECNGTIYYKDEWHLATFYADDIIVTMDPVLVGEVVHTPAESLVKEFLRPGAEFLGWDINGDGLVDEVPVTLTEDLEAHAVVKIPVTALEMGETAVTLEVTKEKTMSVSCIPGYFNVDGELVWTSSDEAIATVDETGKVTALAEGEATITATLKSNTNVSTACTVTVIPLQPGIHLREVAGTMNCGTIFTLEPQYVQMEEIMDQLAFTSSDETIAAVDQSGTITAVGPGTAEITISCGEYTAVYTVTVLVPLEKISINAEKTAMNVEETMALTVEFVPENTTDDRSVIWTSSDEAIAQVNGSGTVTAVAPGTVTITAKTENGLTAEYEITVYAPIKWIKLNTTVGTIRLDRTKQMEVIYEPSNTTDDRTVIWSSSNPEISSISEDGIVTGIKAGTAVITGQVGEHTATYEVTVIGLRDQTTGITVTNSDDTPMDENVELDVDPVEHDRFKEEHYTIWELILRMFGEAFGEKYSWCVYDITLTENGDVVQPESQVDVEMPVRDDMDKEHFKVYRVEEDGTLTDMTAELWGDHACFRTNHFSVYVLGAKVPACEVHTFGEWTVTKDATCTQPGEEMRVCGVCAAEESREIAIMDHSYESVITAAACTEQGDTTHICTVCQHSLIDSYVDAVGHTFGEGVVTQAPTCTKDGAARFVCSVCGYSEVRGVDALGHTYEAVVTGPGCTDRGFTTYTCTDCGDSYEDSYTDAMGHDYSEWETIKEATYEENGEESRVCSRCGKIQTRIIPMLSHSYESVETNPTCTEKGYTTHTCNDCGDSYVDTYIDALGHSFREYVPDNNATCTADGTKTAKCERCDETDTIRHAETAMGHEFVDGTCSRCGEKEVTRIPGDLDGNGTVDVDDVLALLWNVLFPDEYPIEAEADFDGNKSVDVDDVLALLWHVLFPEEYPLSY